MTALLSNLGLDESGATAIEYSLIAGLISLVVLGWATFTGTTLTSVFENIAQSLALACSRLFGGLLHSEIEHAVVELRQGAAVPDADDRRPPG